MVRINSAFCALLFIVPALAVPISTEQLESREPNFGSFVKKVATRKNLKTAAHIASMFFRREDGLGGDAVELSERDLEEFASGLEDLATREPNLHSFLHKVKKVATPHNIHTVANIVKTFVRRELGDDVVELMQRDHTEAHGEAHGHAHSSRHTAKRVASPHHTHRASHHANSLESRALDDDVEFMIAREPNHSHSRHGHAKTHHAHRASHKDNSLESRELGDDDVELMQRRERDHSQSRHRAPKQHHAHRASHHANSLESRELGDDDVEFMVAREPNHSHSRHSHGKEHHTHRASHKVNSLESRELGDDDVEFFGRGISIDSSLDALD